MSIPPPLLSRIGARLKKAAPSQIYIPMDCTYRDSPTVAELMQLCQKNY
jgi:hypothetical protein